MRKEPPSTERIKTIRFAHEGRSVSSYRSVAPCCRSSRKSALTQACLCAKQMCSAASRGKTSVAMESSGGPPPTQAAGAGSEALLAPVQALLQEWRTMALKASGRHSAACDRYQHLDSIYGVGSTVLTAIVGSTIFVTLQKTASETIRIIAGMVAAVAAVASGIQTAAKYAQLAERYRQPSRHYATVARRIDELLADPPDNAHVTGVLDQLRKSLDEVGALAPERSTAIRMARVCWG